jgi:hypothetical protein
LRGICWATGRVSWIGAVDQQFIRVTPAIGISVRAVRRGIDLPFPSERKTITVKVRKTIGGIKWIEPEKNLIGISKTILISIDQQRPLRRAGRQ